MLSRVILPEAISTLISSDGVATTTMLEGPDGCWTMPPSNPGSSTARPSTVNVVPSSTATLSPTTVSWAESDSLPFTFWPCSLTVASESVPVTVRS